jgi:hypothetical protein
MEWRPPKEQTVNKRTFAAIAAGTVLALAAHRHTFADDAALAGVWEGPWYRGMTSGKVKIDLRQSTPSVQFTNLDGFGTQARPLQASLDGGVVILRSDGDKGGPLTANLKMNDARTEMKGLGKYDGFPLRFEVKRVE